MSNLTRRVLTACVAIPIIIFICMAGGLYFFVFIAIASAVSLKEFYSITEAKGAKPLVALGIVAGFFVNLSFYHFKLREFIFRLFESQGVMIPFPTQTQLLVIVLVVTILVLCLVELFRNDGSAILNLSSTLMGIFYIPLFFGTFIGLREVFVPLDFPMLRYFPNNVSFSDTEAIAQVYRWGGYTVISIFAVIWICDSAAYHAGTAFGRHKLYPRVSPNKTWEGAVFGFIFALGSAIAAKYLVLGYLSLSNAVIIGAIVGVFGQLGDLVESLIKRDAGVKDSSALIPGHGGVFDRFDSLLFVAPIVYLYLDYIVFT